MHVLQNCTVYCNDFSPTIRSSLTADMNTIVPRTALTMYSFVLMWTLYFYNCASNLQRHSTPACVLCAVPVDAEAPGETPPLSRCHTVECELAAIARVYCSLWFLFVCWDMGPVPFLDTYFKRWPRRFLAAVKTSQITFLPFLKAGKKRCMCYHSGDGLLVFFFF